MSNERFDFKQFHICQDQCAMKVGTDGVLLGAWNQLPCLHDGSKTSIFRVLDIGTGTGLIALMLAQRLAEENISFHIDAIEIDKDAATQAIENVSDSPWKEQITVIHTSLQDFVQNGSVSKYDLIVSNPPFYNATLKPEDEARSVARHKDALPIDLITCFAQLYLTSEGELRLIYPTSYDAEVMKAATISNLHPLIICDITTKAGKPCKRRLTSFALPSHPQKEIITQTLCIRNKDNEYTPEYLRMVDDFYLRLS